MLAYFSVVFGITYFLNLSQCSDHKAGQAGKAIPLLAWTGPEASMSLRLSDFKTIGT